VIDSGHGGAAAHSERVSAVIACYLDEQAIPIMHERLTTVFTELGVDSRSSSSMTAAPTAARRCSGDSPPAIPAYR